MRDDQHIQPNVIAQLLWKGHLRRSADIGPWLKEYFARRQNARASETKSHPFRRLISLIASASRSQA